MKLFGFFTIIFSVNCAYAQQQGQSFLQENLQEIGQTNNNQMVFTNNNISSSTVGSPYLNDEWAKGNLKLKDRQMLKDLDLKLDLYQNELVLRMTNSEIYLPKEQITFFDLYYSGSKLEFIKSTIGDEVLFLQVLISQGELRLLKHRKITFIPARNEGAYKSASQNDEYKETAKYYLQQNELLIKVPKSYNKFAKIFPWRTAAIKEFLIHKRIDLGREADLIITFDYIHGL